MNVWIVETVDGKAEEFVCEPEGIQIFSPQFPVLVIHRALGQTPIFVNLARVQRWYAKQGKSLELLKA